MAPPRFRPTSSPMECRYLAEESEMMCEKIRIHGIGIFSFIAPRKNQPFMYIWVNIRYMDGLGHEPCKSLTNHPKRCLIGRVASSRFLFHQATTFDGKTTVNEFKY